MKNVILLASAILLLVVCANASRGEAFGIPLSYWGRTDRPPIAEQRKVALEIITDAILSPSLSSIAVVQSPMDALQRTVTNGVNVRRYMTILNFDIVFVSETIYGRPLPSKIYVIQDRMYGEKFISKPRNYRDRLFHHDDSVWLVFLQDDHVLNYDPNHNDENIRRQFEKLSAQGLTYNEILGGLGLDGTLTEDNMFSLIEEYASFLVDVEGPELPPVVKDREEARPLAQLSVPEPEGEFILPPEFLDDLFDILQLLANGDLMQLREQPPQRTKTGIDVAQRISERISDGAPIDHLKKDWARRTTTQPPPPEEMDVVFELSGTVRDEEGRAVTNANIMVSTRHALGGGGGITDETGHFRIVSRGALSRQLRFLVHANGYAPTIESIDLTEMDPDSIDLVVYHGEPVEFDISFERDARNDHSLQEGILYVIDQKHRMFAAMMAPNGHVSGQSAPFVYDLKQPIRLQRAIYTLLWIPSVDAAYDTPFSIHLGERELGSKSVEQIRIGEPAQEQLMDMNELEEQLLVFPTGAD